MKTQPAQSDVLASNSARPRRIHRGRRVAAKLPQRDADRERQMLRTLSEVGLDIVRDARAPVPLLTFGRLVSERLHAGGAALPLAYFADALKRLIADMHHEDLRVLSPSNALGVGYVYDASDPNTWPDKPVY